MQINIIVCTTIIKYDASYRLNILDNIVKFETCPDTRLYSKLISSFHEDVSNIAKIYELMIKFNYVISDNICFSLSREFKYNIARTIDLYKRVIKQPSRILGIYSKFLETFVRRDFDKRYIHDIYEFMKKNYKKLTPEIYELLMQAFVTEPITIAKLYHEMYVDGITINDSIYKYLLQAFDNIPEYLPVVTKIKKMM